MFFPSLGLLLFSSSWPQYFLSELEFFYRMFIGIYAAVEAILDLAWRFLLFSDLENSSLPSSSRDCGVMRLPFRIYPPVPPCASIDINSQCSTRARIQLCLRAPRAPPSFALLPLCSHHPPRLILTVVCSGVRSGHAILCPGKRRDPRPVYWRGKEVGHRVFLEKLSMELCRIEWTEGNFLVFSKVYFLLWWVQ